MMIIDRRRVLGGFSVFAIVLLRLVIGWHFLGQGMEKVEYDRHEGVMHMTFSADGFLGLAKGPLAPLYLAHATSDHEWREKLATPRENVPLTPEQAAEKAKWTKDYAKRRADAKAANQTLPVEFAPYTATQEWATQVAKDWRTAVNRFSAIAGVTDDQKKAAETALSTQLGELSNFIAGTEAEVAEYRHDLWRLAKWKSSPEADGPPFFSQRVTVKGGETASKPMPWRQEVRGYEDALGDDLRSILTQEQRDQATTSQAVEDSLADAHAHKLAFINIVATVLTIGVGLCLIFGFFTRLAAIVGAIFLFGVIASQPFWIPGAAPTINFCVEFAALLVLAGTGAGRWAGIDGCLEFLRGRRNALVVQETN